MNKIDRDNAIKILKNLKEYYIFPTMIVWALEYAIKYIEEN